ncbi:glycosyltransferase family 2 protein [Thalassotalea maritima]|uniref:glycosyltransferase family 2 protein n=1 Tax=Thalassotalea maritima TaxID=3242416 RepID=UPI0035289A69
MTLISVIIPTTAEKARANSINRAINSIRVASKQSVKIIAAVNGKIYDNSVLSYLKKQKDISVIYNPIGSLPIAHLDGRRHVTTPYFAFLDDDDEFFPGALDIRLKALRANPNASVVVTGGYSDHGSTRSLHYKNLANVSANPMEYLFIQNWLASCNNLFDSEKVGIELFEKPMQYFEWTWLAFKLAYNQHQIIGLDTPTFIYHNTEESLSKTNSYNKALPELMTRMLKYPLTHSIKTKIRKRMANYHYLVAMEKLKNSKVNALKPYLICLFKYRGWEYFPSIRFFLSRKKG